MPSLATLVLFAWELSRGCIFVCFFFFLFVWMNVPWVFLTLPACLLI